MWSGGTSGKGLGWSGLAAMLCDSWGMLCHVGRDFSELLLPLEATWASWLYRFHFAEGAARNRCEGVNFCPNFWDPTRQLWIVRPVDARRAVCEMSWRYAHGLRVHLWCLSKGSWNSWRPRGSRSHMMKLGRQTDVLAARLLASSCVWTIALKLMAKRGFASCWRHGSVLYDGHKWGHRYVG